MKSETKIRTANRPQEDELIRLLKWLSPTNWKVLFFNFLQQTWNFMENFPKIQPSSSIPLNIIYFFQAKLITLGFLLTGQRMQVILELKTENSLCFDNKNKCYYLKTRREKTQRKGAARGIPIPYWYGFMLNFWKTEVRPLFKPTDKVIAFWLARDGKAMRRHISTSSRAEITKAFPKTKVNPLQFRRLMVTKFTEEINHEGANENEKEVCLKDLAIYMNTSKEVMENYYNRGNTMQQSIKISKIASSFHATKESTELIEKIEKKAKENEKKQTIENDEVEPEVIFTNKSENRIFLEQFDEIPKNIWKSTKSNKNSFETEIIEYENEDSEESDEEKEDLSLENDNSESENNKIENFLESENSESEKEITLKRKTSNKKSSLNNNNNNFIESFEENENSNKRKTRKKSKILLNKDKEEFEAFQEKYPFLNSKQIQTLVSASDEMKEILDLVEENAKNENEKEEKIWNVKKLIQIKSHPEWKYAVKVKWEVDDKSLEPIHNVSHLEDWNVLKKEFLKDKDEKTKKTIEKLEKQRK